MQNLPRKITVKKLINSRYKDGIRPISWDNRFSGIDKVITDDGEELTLLSDGGQSTPAPGWILMLTKNDSLQAKDGTNLEGLAWTLYGIAKSE